MYFGSNNSSHFNRPAWFNKLFFTSILLILLSIVLCSCKRTKHQSKKSKYGHVQKQRKQKSEEKVSSRKSNEKIDKVITSARSFTGTRYRMGGVTRAGMDCSGLMCTAFSSADITLPRTSSAQSQIGRDVDIDELEKGDLVFFTDRKGRKTVTHVGMVTEIKGEENVRFIHASTKLGVIEDNLFAPYYISIFVKAVRLF